MTPADVALVTTTAYMPEPADDDWYNRQIHEEDRLLSDGLATHGLTSARVDWNDPSFDWSSVRCAVVRTTWDYSYRFEQFAAWLDRASAHTRIVNSTPLMQWNMDKHYLADLARKGVAVVETVFVESGEAADLVELTSSRGWQEIVIKPAVSGGARSTYRAEGDEIRALQQTFDSCIAAESMLVQPFQKEILRSGEMSLMLMGGRFTHAIRKMPKPGDFRVQDDHGGTVHPYEPSPELIRFAEQAVSACPEPPTYARVDLVLSSTGPKIIELELVEPELWMRFAPSSAMVLAEAIAELVGNRQE